VPLCTLPLSACLTTLAVFDDAQTGGVRARRFLLMRCKELQLALWALGASLSTVSCLAFGTNNALSAPTARVLPVAVNSWPWMALGAIVLLLTIIARASRRRLPFGPRL